MDTTTPCDRFTSSLSSEEEKMRRGKETDRRASFLVLVVGSQWWKIVNERLTIELEEILLHSNGLCSAPDIAMHVRTKTASHFSTDGVVLKSLTVPLWNLISVNTPDPFETSLP